VFEVGDLCGLPYIAMQLVPGQTLGVAAHYMSPEQAVGDPGRVDRRSDVYALGASLYELLAGEVPFKGQSSAEVLVKVLGDAPVPLRKRDPRIPVDLETIVMKCLQKEPQDRYDSARALADDLGRYLDGEPIAARRTSWPYRLGKAIRRNRALVREQMQRVEAEMEDLGSAAQGPGH
jgi:serine/threonine-protein kinase